MITNADLTVYHLIKDDTTRMGKWERHNYEKIWWFSKESVTQVDGYENSNNLDIRITYKNRDNLDIKNFSKGDIVLKGIIKKDINSIAELSEYETYVITSTSNNDFGNNPHIHIQGH